jgi:phospholipid transport system substrate-binding protein
VRGARALAWLGRISASLLVPLAAALAASSVAEESTARATIERLDAVYLDVMKNAVKLGYTGRFAKLEPVLGRSFDFSAMARLSVGGRWKALEPEQQQKFVATFARLSVATYAGRFTGYAGESFEILGEEPSAQATVLVRTRVVVPGDEPVQLDYRLRQGPDGWRIIDVFLNGTVSELALRRSEYAAVLDRDGFDALIAALEEKISGFATRSAALTPSASTRTATASAHVVGNRGTGRREGTPAYAPRSGGR